MATTYPTQNYLILFFDLDRDSRKVTQEAWLICPNQNKVRRFTKNKNNNKFFEYMFVDSGIVVDAHGDKPPLMKTRKAIKIDDARKEYQKLITAGWQVTEPKWQ